MIYATSGSASSVKQMLTKLALFVASNLTQGAYIADLCVIFLAIFNILNDIRQIFSSFMITFDKICLCHYQSIPSCSRLFAVAWLFTLTSWSGHLLLYSSI